LIAAIGTAPVAAGDAHLHVTASVGFSTYPLKGLHQPLAWERALDLVDAAPYMAKRQGRHRACGVAEFVHDDPESLCMAESDLEAAANCGVIRLVWCEGGRVDEPSKSSQRSSESLAMASHEGA